MEGKAVANWAMALAVGFAIIAVGFRWAGWLLSIFFVVNCLVLVIVVLLQSGKAADLAGAFGGAGSQTAFGPRGAANALSKATTWCAIMFMVCALALVLRVDKGVERGGSVLQNVSKPAPAQPKQAPVIPAPATPTPSNTAPAAPAQQPNQNPQSQAPQSNPPANNSKPQQQPPAQQPKPQSKP
jgi:preprotein translocase subunit SecG